MLPFFLASFLLYICVLHMRVLSKFKKKQVLSLDAHLFLSL